MKWLIYFVCLVYATTGLVSQDGGNSPPPFYQDLWKTMKGYIYGESRNQMLELDGGNPNATVIGRHPFYTNPQQCSLTVTLTSPVDGASYYTNQIDINYTYSGTPTGCWYKIDSFLWNEIPCNGSIRRTLISGEQTLVIHIENSICSVEDSATFTVYERADYWGYIDYWFMLWIFIGMILIIFRQLYVNKKT